MRGPGRDDPDRGRAARRRSRRRHSLKAHLRALAEECAERWTLRLGHHFEAYHSYVVGAELPDGREVVLKAYVDDHQGQALVDWSGRGAVRVLAHDKEKRVVLLERCLPGTQLWELPDDEATEAAAGVLEQLWVPADRPYRRLEDLAVRWTEIVGMRLVERKLADEAVAFLREAGPTQHESVLLHQDLHGGNVLLSQRGWLAIDPQPVVGEREFDVASLIRDRRPTNRRAMLRRLDYLVERLGLDRERARGWGIAHALAWNGSGEMVEAARFLSAPEAL